jgi:hypothetical protein
MRRINLLFSVEHGESVDEVVLGEVAVDARLSYYIDELFEL